MQKSRSPRPSRCGEPHRTGACVLVATAIVLICAAPARADRACADVDCSGRVTASDALVVLKSAVGQTIHTACRATCGETASTTSTSLPASGSTSTTIVDSPIQPGDLVVSEIMADPAAVADSVGEWFEIINVSGRVLGLDGLSVRDDASDLHVLAGAGLQIAAGQAFVLARNGDSAQNGGLAVDYVYSDFVLGNSADEIILEYAGTEIDRVAYAAGFVTTGAAASLDPAATDAASNDEPANWCPASQALSSGDRGSPGAANPACPHGP